MGIEVFTHEHTGRAVLVCNTSGYAIEMRHFDSADDAEQFLAFCAHQGVDPRHMDSIARAEARDTFDELHVCKDCDERILVPSETRPTEQCARCEESERYDNAIAAELDALVQADDEATAMLPDLAANGNGGGR